MRALLVAGLVCFTQGACSRGGKGDDAGAIVADASGADAGTHDSGLFPVSCGDATCTSEQYCQVDPTGACAPATGASCAVSEELCQKGGDAGCTTPRTRECRALPAACAATAQCACMINQNLCPNAVQTNCRRPVGEGVTIECPFP